MDEVTNVVASMRLQIFEQEIDANNGPILLNDM